MIVLISTAGFAKEKKQSFKRRKELHKEKSSIKNKFYWGRGESTTPSVEDRPGARSPGYLDEIHQGTLE
jgi:hypothetical protein